LAPESVAGRPGEVEIGGHDAVGAEVWENQPEHGVNALEGLSDDVDVAV